MGVLTEQMKQTIERVRLGFVATVCADGTPNLSPKGTVCVLDDEHLMFADLNSPGTIANLRANSAVEVNVVDPFVRKGFRFKGAGAVLDSGAEFERLVGVFAARGTPDAPRRIRAVVVIRVDRARPVISPAYDRMTDEAEVRARWVRHYLKGERGA
jgi:uncharacterized protein